MRYQDALSAVREALRACGLTPNPNGEYAVYFNFTTKALTLHRRQLNSTTYVAVAGEEYIKANKRSLKKDGTPKYDFWIVGFNDFYQAFTFFMTLWQILWCRYGEFFTRSLDNSAKPTPTFPF